MLKNNKGYIVMFVLLSQTILSITLGMLSLHFSSKGHILPNVYINSIDVGNLTKSEAVSIVKEHYDKLSENSSLVIRYDDREFKIKLSDIDFSIDYEATADEAYYINDSSRFEKLIRGFFSNKKMTISPQVNLNEEKLKIHMEELAILVDKAPANARISFHNGELIKTPHQLGTKLNISNSIEKIKSEIGKSIGEYIEFDAQNNFEISWIWPELTLAHFNGIDSVISSYSTPILNSELSEDIKKASKALNGFLVMGSDLNNGNYKEFSFIKRLKEKGVSIDGNNEGYDQVASTLYAALLKTGIGMDYIDRKKQDTIAEYIAPGLEVKVSEVEDFSFRNPFDFPIAVFTECDDKNITVYIIGRRDYPEKEIGIKVTKRDEPTVLKVVNYDLKPLEEKIINSGKPSVSVEVYRVMEDNGDKSLEILYDNSYETVKTIIQVGPKK